MTTRALPQEHPQGVPGMSADFNLPATAGAEPAILLVEREDPARDTGASKMTTTTAPTLTSWQAASWDAQLVARFARIAAERRTPAPAAAASALYRPELDSSRWNSNDCYA